MNHFIRSNTLKLVTILHKMIIELVKIRFNENQMKLRKRDVIKNKYCHFRNSTDFPVMVRILPTV